MPQNPQVIMIYADNMSNKTKQGAQSIMGMAASQARLLSITSRLSDNEFNAQGIMRTKMQNSKETDKLSEDYRRSLDSTKMIGQAYTEDGLKNLDLSYNLVAGNAKMPLQTQYAVTNSNGQLIIPASTGTKYNKAVEGVDWTSEASIGNAFDKFIKMMDDSINIGPVPITIEEWDAINMPWCMKDPNGPYQKYEKAREEWGAANKELREAQDNFNLVNSQLNPVQVEFTATESDDNRYEILLSDPNRRAKIIAFAQKGTGDGSSIPATTTTITLGKTDTDPGRSYSYTVPSMAPAFNLYRWDPNLSDDDNLEIYLSAVLNHVSNADGTVDAGQAGGYTDGEVGEWGNIGEANVQAIRNFFFPEAIANLPVFDQYGNQDNARTRIGKLSYSNEEARLYREALDRLNNATTNEAAKKADMEAKEAIWDTASAADQEEINEYNIKRSEHLEKYAAYCKNKYAIYSDPKQAEYYSNLFNQIATRGAVTVPDEQLNNKEWFQQALKSGQIFLEKFRADGTWESCHWKTEPGMSEMVDNEKAGKIKTKYELDLDKLQRKEDALDMQLKNIETEHSALQTEFDGVKTVIQKNIERSFKTLG